MSFLEGLNTRVLTFTEDHLANVIAALLILVVGFFALLFVTYLVRKYLFSVLKINHYFAKFTGRAEAMFNLEKTFLRIFFFVAFLGILSAASQVAQVDYLVEFFERIFNWVGVLGALAFRALLPITLALIFSYLAKVGTLWLGQKFKLDDRLGNKLDAGEAVPFSITKSFSEVAYGVVFLYFLPEILKGIGLEKLSGPITKMFEDVVAFFPRLLVAGLILFLGWFVAKLVRQIFEGLLESLGVDAALKKMFGENILGSLRVSKILPTVLYVFILGLALVQSLGKLELQTITSPIEKLLENAVAGLPLLLFAVLLVFAAVYFGKFVSAFVSGLLKDIGFDNVYAKIGLSEMKTGAQSPSQIIGFLACALLVFLATIQALDTLGLNNISEILNTLIYKLFDVMVGVLVFGVGLYIAKNVSSWVEHATHAGYSKLLSLVVRVVIVVIASAMALQQVGIADEIVTIAFALAMGSLALGVAIAIGLGAKDIAGEVAKNFVSKFK